MNLSYKDLIDLCHTKARYYQNKASELNDANYLSDSKFCLAMADYLLKAEQEISHTLSQKATNTADIEQRVAEACAKLCAANTNPSMYWSSEIIPGAFFAEAIRSGKWR